ncbi:putative nucleic acid-binding Zn ribbon protein [Streptomyces filamentosus]
MTDTLNPPPAPTTTPSSVAPSGATVAPGAGADLARIALHQARVAAKARGQATRAPRRRPRPNGALPDRRDPAGFAVVLQHLMAERAWDMPAAGGTVLARWPGIAAAVSPTLPAHVQATGYDPEAGRLDLRPDSPAYATQLRLLTARIIATANEHVGSSAVRALRVLPPGAVDTTPPPAAADRPAFSAAAAPGGPVKTRETASPGYRRALKAHRAAAPKPLSETAAEGIPEHQVSVVRERSLPDFPEPAEDEPVSTEEVELRRRHQAALTHAAALHRARADRAARQHPTTISTAEGHGALYAKPAA